MQTPRLVHLLIGIVLAAFIAAVLALMFFAVVMLSRGEPFFVGEVWAAPLLVPVVVGGATMVVALPIAALLRAVARTSVIANAIGFLAYVNLTPLLFGPGMKIGSEWVAMRIIFALFGAIAIAIALRVNRRVTRRSAAKQSDLSETFG